MTLDIRPHGPHVAPRRRPMMPLVIAAAVVGCLGCGQPVPIDVVSLGDRSHADDIALVDDAVALLGVEWELTEPRYGSIHLVLVEGEESPGAEGVATRGVCRKFAASIRAVLPLAHELGHCLGLEHICEGEACTGDLATNLMTPGADGSDLTDEQLDDIDKGRRRLTACR